MLNYINYYYDLYPNTVNELDNSYVFYSNNEKYYLTLYTREEKELDIIIKLNKEMIERGSLVHEIVFNKYNKPLTLINNKNYILLRVYVNDTKKVSIDDIFEMINNNDNIIGNNILNHSNWNLLWSEKIDYIEFQMGHLIKKYSYLYSIIDYYIGLGENAIEYFKMIDTSTCSLTISHKRIGISSTLYDFYNPLNLIIDYKVRDIGEYIKSAFFNDCNVFEIIKYILNNYMFDKFNISLLFSRLLYPSYFFDIYDSIMEFDINENTVSKIIKKSSSYEDFLSSFIKSNNLQVIEWLI